jgi:hypothetical protein
VVAALATFDVLRGALGDFNRAEADERAELDNQVVASARGGAAEVLDLVVGYTQFKPVFIRSFRILVVKTNR